MAKKNSKNSGPSFIIGIIIIVIGFLIYAVTGVDLLGITTTSTETPDNSTVISTPAPPRVSTGNFTEIPVGIGYGYQGDFWELYFTAPLNSRPRDQYVNGVDVRLANAINNTQNTLDIAAFELDNHVIVDAILAAHERGVTVRVVTDDDHGLEVDDFGDPDPEAAMSELMEAGIPVVNDDRSGLMHNKFLIMDGINVWMGSMNLTQNGVYRNNNNGILIRSVRVAQVYQEEFDEMFIHGEFGIRSDPSNTGDFTVEGVPIEIYFASENQVINALIDEIDAAEESIRFMAFSFTRDDLGQAVLRAAQRGVDVQGMFEVTGSETTFSEMTMLLCAGLDVRQDGNNGVLHHKVFVIDDSTVITGSFNFSNNAVESNDENVMIIRDGDLASLYTDEFLRVQSIGAPADDIECN